MGLNSSQLSHNMHMDHHGPNSKLGRVWHTTPSKDLMSSSAQHTHNRANDDQKRSLLAHTTVHPVPTHVPRRAPRRAYMHNEPHVCAPDQHAPVATKVSSGTFVTPSESKRLRSTLHAERTTPTIIPLMFSSSLRVQGLTRGWLDGL
jgi:hypothetical protein